LALADLNHLIPIRQCDPHRKVWFFTWLSCTTLDTPAVILRNG